LGVDSKGNQGEFDDIAKSFQELFIALTAAIFLTYVVLVLQFRSFSLPVIMLFTIPLAAVGVFPALYLVDGQLGFLEILGFTILVGIVENVAIFLVDYANQLVKERKMSLRDAIILSSGVRFRPIILTKVVALGGLLPLALFSPFWRGLSSVIIGGILVSGFLSMTVVPIFYTWFGAVRGRVHRFFR
jgi:multidrug efflux pump subunit AcrB